ncbi:MAG: hypothetical protein UZ21_OP11001000471 [Microgenomates bacterium OLB22]|nr:MAG: hypothetical protein UZ21_OP11001000471 [Microgenomates bacterium OLB22]
MLRKAHSVPQRSREMLINLKAEAAEALDRAIKQASTLINKAVLELGRPPTDGDELLIKLEELGIPERDLRKVVRVLAREFPNMDVSIWTEWASAYGETWKAPRGIRVYLVKETFWQSLRRFIGAG